MHPGHIRYLRFARELGDILIVSLTGDDRIDKAPDRPYIPQELRAENLAALEFVDWVVIDPHPTAAELLEQLQPDVYVKGREYAQTIDPRFLREREIVERYGGRVVFHSGDVVFSSTRLIRSLEHDEHLDEVRLRALCSRAGIDLVTVQAALNGFVDVPTVVVGDLIRERYVLCDASEAADDAPVLSVQQLGVSSYWGGAAAVALQLQSLGANPTLITATTRTEEAARPEAGLVEAGVEVRALPIRQDLVQRSTYVADDAKLFRVNAGVSHALDSSWEGQAVTMIRAQLAQARLLIWCDHGYGMITSGLVRAVTQAARDAGVVIVGCAPGLRGNINVLSDTDLICVTERRLRETLHDMGTSLPTVTSSLLNRTNSRAALVSLHKRGLIGFAGHSEESGRLRSEFVPALAAHHVDLLGVEEAILVAAALTLSGGQTLTMATYLAAGLAAVAAARPGRVPVTTGDLCTWLSTRAELRPQSRFLPDAATIADLARLAPPLAGAAVLADENELDENEFSLTNQQLLSEKQ